MVIDSSALLAVVFEEPLGEWAVERMDERAGELRMSTINLAEVLIRVRDRQPQRYARIEDSVFTAGIRFVAPDVDQARVAAEARARYPLNLGDCFAYALARQEGCPILTLDRDFRATDVPVVLPP
jgi:ribonuclease VapC